MSEPTAAPAILVVEDEPLIADLVQGALEDAGFAVTMTSDDADAMAQLEADSGRDFVGLVTDVNLGRERDGWDVARRARELSPAIAVVYCSGASAHDWTAKGVPNSVILPKPFAPAQLVVALSNLMNAGGSDASG
jgi:DNA-binding response OmpR family regulator